LFWYRFVVGDDLRLALGLLVAVLLTWLLVRSDVAAWWLLPAAVAVLLAESLRRAAR
jgi:hypothetical protein